MGEIALLVLGLFWKAGVYKQGIDWFGSDTSRERASWNTLIWVAVGFSVLGAMIRFLNYVPFLVPITALVYIGAYVGVFASYFRLDLKNLLPFALVNVAGGVLFEVVRWVVLSLI